MSCGVGFKKRGAQRILTNKKGGLLGKEGNIASVLAARQRWKRKN